MGQARAVARGTRASVARRPTAACPRWVRSSGCAGARVNRCSPDGTPVRARRLIPRGRDAGRAHARRLGGGLLGHARRAAALLRRAARAHRAAPRAGAPLPAEARPGALQPQRPRVGGRRELRDRPPPLLGARAAAGAGGRSHVDAPAPRPPAVGDVDLPGTGGQPLRADRQGPPLHGGRARRGGAGVAAAGHLARGRPAARGVLDPGPRTRRRAPAGARGAGPAGGRGRPCCGRR